MSLDASRVPVICHPSARNCYRQPIYVYTKFEAFFIFASSEDRKGNAKFRNWSDIIANIMHSGLIMCRCFMLWWVDKARQAIGHRTAKFTIRK